MNERNRDNRLNETSRGRVRVALLSSILALSGLFVLAAWMEVRSQVNSEPDVIAPHLTGEQRIMRQRFYDLRRMLPNGIPPMARTRAIEEAQISAETIAAGVTPSPTTWTFIGPQPITSGQGISSTGFCGSPPRINVNRFPIPQSPSSTKENPVS